MSQSPAVLDLSITLTKPPEGSPPEDIASITLNCPGLGLSHTGDLLKDPLSKQERDDLRWYLEEYWKWPYYEFAKHGKQVEALLPKVGRRLYDNVFGASLKADRILQAWRLKPEAPRQISIISDIPSVLSLPWELLHDEQGFLALRTRNPISIIRRLEQGELAELTAPFEPPLRILLLTARPEGTGFIDPRGVAHELLDEVEEQVKAGAVALEFLRPSTLAALRSRLMDMESSKDKLRSRTGCAKPQVRRVRRASWPSRMTTANLPSSMPTSWPRSCRTAGCGWPCSMPARARWAEQRMPSAAWRHA